MVKCPNCGKLVMNNKMAVCPKCMAVLPNEAGAACTVAGGLEAMANNRFDEGCYRWRVSYRKDGPPTDEQFSQMMDASLQCILSHLGDKQFYSRDGFAGLALDLSDRDMMEWMMRSLADSLDAAQDKNQLHRLSAEYMYFVFESYYVFPDIRDISNIMRDANATLKKFQSALADLPGESKYVESEIASFIDYTKMLREKIELRVSKETRDGMNAIVNHWDTRKNLDYADSARQVAMAYSQAVTAKKFKQKRLDDSIAQTDAYLDKYFQRQGGYVEPPKR